MSKVKFGIIGLGKIANTFGEDLIQSDKASLYAVASRSKERGELFAKKYGAKKVYQNYEDIANDDEVDVIYIATPHVFHKEISIMCMEKGKSVLCEKPAGINEKELQEMINCAKENDVFFMEGMWTRFFPISLQLKSIINSKELGEVRHIEANFGYGSWNDENINNNNNRLFSPGLAGGAILDVGIYPIALTTWIKDKSPDKIVSVAKMTDLGVDRDVISVCEYNDNCLAMVQCSVCQSTTASARIFFDEGKIEIENFFRPSHIKITYDNGTINSVYDDYKSKGYNGFIYEIDHVADCLLNGNKMSTYYSWEDSLEIVKIMDIIRCQIGLKYPKE